MSPPIEVQVMRWCREQGYILRRWGPDRWRIDDPRRYNLPVKINGAYVTSMDELYAWLKAHDRRPM